MAHTISGVDADESAARILAAIPGAPRWAVTRCSNQVGTCSACSPIPGSCQLARIAHRGYEIAEARERNRFIVPRHRLVEGGLIMKYSKRAASGDPSIRDILHFHYIRFRTWWVMRRG
jgi:hypothetical protein